MDKQKLQRYKKLLAIPRQAKKIILAAVLGVFSQSVKAQPEKLPEEVKDAIEQTTLSTYDSYKVDYLANIRAPFIRMLENLLQERVKKMQPAERADRRMGRYYTANRKKALQSIFGAVPTACLRYYCAFAAFNTIRDAAAKCGFPEYASYIGDFLSNMNSCPVVIKDLNAACKELNINNPKGLTISQRMEKDAADDKIGVYACIVRSTRNTRSGLHFRLYVAQIDDNGKPIRDPQTNNIICTEYNFNRSSAEVTSNANSIPVAMFNLTEIADKCNEQRLIKNYLSLNPPMLAENFQATNQKVEASSQKRMLQRNAFPTETKVY